MGNPGNNTKRSVDRRSFMKRGLLAGGAATVGAGMLANGTSVYAQGTGGSLTSGDIAILRFLAAAELIESDLWQQYAELGGIGTNLPIEVDPNQTLNSYQAALSNLDADGPQYITSNTLDEMSHAAFLNAYLISKGADPIDFTPFANLQGSSATIAKNIGRLTNLMNLNVDTSWFIRYRSSTNPEFGGTYPQLIDITNQTAIPRDDAEFNFPHHIQVVANTAAFHFGFIEQGGSSLYAAMSQKVTSPEVLQITLGIGGDEIAHFLEWVDFAGNSVQAPVAPVTSQGLTFPNFFSNPPIRQVQPSLIFPVPCEFIGPHLPKCSVIRPISSPTVTAVGAVASLTADGLFIGQSAQFLSELQSLAVAADAAVRG